MLRTDGNPHGLNETGSIPQVSKMLRRGNTAKCPFVNTILNALVNDSLPICCALSA
jgi:hypothetical protein